MLDADKTRMAALLFSTSHLEYCSFSNKLNLPLVPLQRRQNIDPYLAQITGLFDDQKNFTGFFTAATLTEFSSVEAVSYYRDEMKAMDAAYDEFIGQHATADDFMVASLAVEERHRGKGIFNCMLQEIKRMARCKGSKRIVLTVWEQNDALHIYLKKGFRVGATFDYAQALFFEKLHLLQYDLA